MVVLQYFYESILFILLQLILCWNCVLTSISSKQRSLELKDQVYPTRHTCHEVERLFQNLNVTLKLCPQGVRNRLTADEHLYFGIKFEERQLYLQVSLSNNFLAPTFNIEEQIGELYSESIVDDDVRKCFYEGSIVNEKSSKVTLNICGGLRGAIRSSSGDQFITPVQTTTSIEGEHYIFVPELPSHDTKRNGSSCGITENKNSKGRKIMHDYQFRVDASGSVRLTSMKNTRKRRALSQKRYVETMVVADESMFAFYGRNEIELRRYILSVMAIVTSVMKDNSIGNFVDVAVIKLVILKKNPAKLKITGDASSSLKRFCKWQKRQNKLNDDHPEHFDTAILLTRNDLCSASCDTLGLAELATACDPIRSCSIVEDNGLSSAFTIAHELGHLLNAPHDGDNNECNELNGKVHIMTPTFNMRSKTWTWSSCSRNFITRYLESSRASCLLDKPSPKFEHPLPLKLPGEMFTLREQCQLVYGDNSTICPLFGRCNRLWCIQYRNGKKSCQTNNMPWADGTKCGTKSWCVRGKCQQKHKMTPVNGQWGAWSAFDGCSRTCGGGIKYATRRCDKPKPAYNGNYCIGPRHKYKSCNTQACPSGHLSFRAVQCNSFNGKNLGIPGVLAGITWLPKQVDKKEDNCKLFCEMKGYKGIYYELSPKVIDGTKCRRQKEDTKQHVQRYNDICVDGQCKPAGCDNVLYSNVKVDNCGVCNGDNSTCRTFVGYKNKTHTGYNFVAHIPSGASSLEVLQQSSKPGKHDTNFLALLNEEKRYIFNGEWTVSLGHKKFSTHGTTIYYSGPNEQNETISIPTTLRSDIEIQVLSTESNNLCNIKYSYNFPVSGKQKYKWAVRNVWSECFPICKGFQVKEYKCQREFDSQVVSSTKCPGKRPQAQYRRCNQNCELKWIVYPSECVPVRICGNGVQEQKVACMMIYDQASNHDNKIATHKDCHKAKIGKKPAREIPCYSPCSTVRWIYSAWGECNQTCGGGRQIREAFCVKQSENSTTPSKKCKNETRGLIEKPCSTHQCPKWHTGAWSGACSVTCGHGVVERVVYCTIHSQTVEDQTCDNHTKPGATRPCELVSCAIWKYTAWSKCSKPCGRGYQIRKVYCETGNGEKVKDQECHAAYKYKNRQKCFLEPCVLYLVKKNSPAAPNNVLRNVHWLGGIWGECSRSCGSGYRERVVLCGSNNGFVAESSCDPKTKLANKELCNVFSCPFWRHGAWSKCTKVCGNGTQTRLVLCGYNATIVTDEYCTQKRKPNERRFCNQNKCKRITKVDPIVSSYGFGEWNVSSWSQCSTTCGVGVKTRNVTCLKDNCAESSKPAVMFPCGKDICPGWNYGQWTQCFTELGCGSGWQARLVVCQMENGSVLADKSCEMKYRPVNNRSCELEPCQQNVDWVTTSWHPCNVPCGEGIQFRYVSCESKQGNSHPEEQCAVFKGKPIEQKPCSRPACPKWHAGEWEKCDQTCFQRREIKCQQGEDRIDDTLCKLENRPIEERECGNENCIRDPVFTWKVQTWSPCGTTCGYSLRSRIVTCTNDQDRNVNDTLCAHLGKKPKLRELCFEGTCPPPRWVSAPWNECSATCGAGVQVRRIYCHDFNGAHLNDSACKSPKNMTTVRMCNLGKCGEYSNHWMAGPWSECTLSCGIGEKRRIIKCVSDKNITQDDDKCVQQNMPANMKVCNIHKCPSVSCRELQHNSGINIDGDQTLQIGNQSLRVYCEGMHRNNPKEFITLKADPKENFAEVYGKRLRNWRICPDSGRRQVPCVNCIDYRASGLTMFRKARIDIKRMVIIPEDRTFADRFGQNPPAFANAGDCYSIANCPQGRFVINFEGTGLRVADNVSWTSRGYNTSKQIFRSRNGQMVRGKCGGFCGMCSPSKKYGLKVEIVKR